MSVLWHNVNVFGNRPPYARSVPAVVLGCRSRGLPSFAENLTMNTPALFCVALVGTILGANAFAQTNCPDSNPPVNNTNCLSNPGFETLNPFSSAGEPSGWHNLSNPNHARRRTVGHGLTPALLPVGSPPGSLTPNSGNAVIELSTDGGAGFIGFTTDTTNFSQANFPYYDPVFDYSGGDVIITARYMVPTNAPVTGDVGAIKINIKLGN